jgi:hypothetical protein
MSTPTEVPHTASLVRLNHEEQQAMDALLGVMGTITRTWDMTSNSNELAAAVHVIQGFIVQHMLHRLNPTAHHGRPFPQADWAYLLYTGTGALQQHQPSPTLTPWWWHA